MSRHLHTAMGRTALLGGIGIFGVALLALASNRDALAQLSLIAGVRLQNATPGVADAGHANISGTMRASQFVGIGSGLTGVDADTLDGLNSSAFLQSVPTPLILTGSASETIRAENSGIQGAAVRGIYTGTTPGFGGLFESSNGSGVKAIRYGNGGYAGDFTASGFSGSGIWALSSSTSGTGRGIEATSRSPDGFGAYGLVVAGTQNAGVFGSSWAENGNGIIGSALSGTFAYAVWAKAPQSVGVFCQGALTVTGAKNFRIDHPFDPEGSYLYHYCSEGPEPLNVYSGNVVTNGQGYATIGLPNYFEEVNRDFRYQLTVIDDSDDFALVKVVRGVAGNSFTIRTNKPGVTVSWQVTGVRNDLYTRHYGAPVEVEKTDKDRGTYQHPELYGLPKERMFGYMAVRDRNGRKQQ